MSISYINKITIIKGDITKENVDDIINSVNDFRGSFKLALEKGVNTIVFKGISMGVNGCSKELAAKTAFNTIIDLLGQFEKIEKVKFVCFDDYTYKLYLALYENYTKEIFRPLLDFISYFEDEKIEFVSWSHGGNDKDGLLTMSYPKYDKGLINFIKAVENSGIIMNNYLEFLADKIGIKNDINSAIINGDLNTIRAALTYFIRQERFCDGLWGKAVNDKTFLHILYRAKELLDNSEHDRCITSMEITRENWGIITSDDISKSQFHIDISGKIKMNFFNMSNKKPVKRYEYMVQKNETQEFFSKLVKDVKVLKWEDDYTVEVCDGFHYEIIIKCSDSSVKKVKGTIEPPTNGKLFQDMVYGLAKYTVKPWIFN